MEIPPGCGSSKTKGISMQYDVNELERETARKSMKYANLYSNHNSKNKKALVNNTKENRRSTYIEIVYLFLH